MRIVCCVVKSAYLGACGWPKQRPGGGGGGAARARPPAQSCSILQPKINQTALDFERRPERQGQAPGRQPRRSGFLWILFVDQMPNSGATAHLRFGRRTPMGYKRRSSTSVLYLVSALQVYIISLSLPRCMAYAYMRTLGYAYKCTLGVCIYTKNRVTIKAHIYYTL